jgi:hypothetical protein
MRKSGFETKADDIIDNLPENGFRNDLMMQINVRQKIEKGIQDAENGNVYSMEEVRLRFCTPEE